MDSATIAASGLYAAQYQVGATASLAANAPDGNATPAPNAPFGSTAVVATSTGFQPGGVSGNAYNALQTALGSQPSESQHDPNDPNSPTQQQLSQLAAQQYFQSALTSVQIANASNNTTISVVG